MTVNQKCTGKTLAFQQTFLLSLAIFGLCTIPATVRAQGQASSTPAAMVRLIPANEKPRGTYVAGLTVTMDARSHTYWRMPGDAGVPPVFDFSGSDNLGKAEILFPAPSRISEDGLDAFGYAGAVTFPLLVTPADPAKPTTLRAEVNVAVCGKICIPVADSVEIELPGPPAPGDQAALDRAIASVPKALPEINRGDLVLAQTAKAPKPSWTLTWNGIMPVDDIFAEAPDGYVFTTKRNAGPGGWTLTAAAVADDKSSKWVPVTLTLAGKTGAVFTTRTLDVSSKSP